MLMTLIAYVIVIPLVQFALTLGVMIGILPAWIIAIPFKLLPEKIFSGILSFVNGIFASVAAIGFGYLVFRFLVGKGSFGAFPFLAAAIPLTFPILNDYRKANQMSNVAAESDSERVEAFTAPMTNSMYGAAIGEFAGLFVAYYLYLVSGLVK